MPRYYKQTKKNNTFKLDYTIYNNNNSNKNQKLHFQKSSVSVSIYLKKTFFLTVFDHCFSFIQIKKEFIYCFL